MCRTLTSTAAYDRLEKEIEIGWNISYAMTCRWLIPGPSGVVQPAADALS